MRLLHLQDTAQEIQNAVAMLRCVEWNEIRMERFPLTPLADFDSIAAKAAELNSRFAVECRSREKWLADALLEDTTHKSEVFAEGWIFFR